MYRFVLHVRMLAVSTEHANISFHGNFHCVKRVNSQHEIVDSTDQVTLNSLHCSRNKQAVECCFVIITSPVPTLTLDAQIAYVHI